MMTPLIQLRKVNKTFNKGKSNALHVLKDIDLVLPDKGLVMLLGPSGSGKTTLLNVLGGLDRFDKGSIDILAFHLNQYKSHTWDHIRNFHVGYIFQNYHLLPNLSVYENIAYVLRLMGIDDEKLIEERVHYVLKSVNMFKFRKKNALQLSGGQQQRVAIARAIVKNPDIIIADEPTGNLDSTNTLEVMTMLKQISKEKLVLMVTHEKELASFYADRIIQIEDGLIKDELMSDGNTSLALKYDETIYLKDLSSNTLMHEGIEIQTFQDDKKMNVKAMLIVKNNTVFVQFDPSIKKVKILDDRSTIKIKNEYQKDAIEAKKAEQSFDYEQLVLPKSQKKKPFMFSLKRAILMALEKVFMTTRRGKIMLFSFLLSGIVVAYAASSLAAVLFLSPEANMPLPRGYYQVTLNNEGEESVDITTFEILESLKEDLDATNYIHTLSQQFFYFVAPTGLNYQTSINSMIDIVEHANDDDLFLGKMPSHDLEILITKTQADNIINTSQGQDIGIWTYNHLLQETLRVENVLVKISGILDHETNVIYMTRNLTNMISTTRYQELIPLRSLQLFEDTILAGALPQDHEILIPKGALSFFNITLEDTYPKVITFNSKLYVISGIYDQEEGPAYATHQTIEDWRFISQNVFYVFGNEEIIQTIESIYNNPSIRITDLYEAAKQIQNSEMSTVIVSTYSTAFIVIGIASIGFFFVIRSSLVKRQYEIAIMRAIGVYKKDIMRAFLVEIIVLSTLSTLIGYALGTYGFSILSDSVLGTITLFKVNILSVVGGLIIAYMINIIAGMLPVWRLLLKTPAQILSQYDM
jgi:ABC-type lipoprotein export system ATPase subunit